MISEDLQKQISAAHKFRQELEAMIYRRGECTLDDRGVQLIAYFALILDHHCAVLSLLSQELFGSAFALVRPLIEVTVRSHVVLMCSPEDLVKIREDEYRVSFKEVGAKIDTFFGLETLMQEFLANGAKALHSYTHGGRLQVQRRFDGTSLQPCYRDGEIVEVISTITSALFMVTNLVTKHFKYEEEWKRTGDLFMEWCKKGVHMSCKIGDELNERYAEATRAVGLFALSIEGSAGEYSRQQEKDNLEGIASTTRSAYLERREKCSDCQSA